MMETRDKTDGSVRRRRECLDCGMLFSTIETINSTASAATILAAVPPDIVKIKPKRPTRSQIDRFLDVALKRY